MPIYEEENKEKDAFDQANDALKGNVEQEEQDDISRYMFSDGNHTSISYVFSALKPISPEHKIIFL